MRLKQLLRRIIKDIWDIDGISLFWKKKKKNILRHIYKKKYSADDLVSLMCELGMREGSIVFLHSSMTEFYNYTGTARELIDKIICVIGENGTLMMPAYPKDKFKLIDAASKVDYRTKVVFDVNNTPSGAGYLTEFFRKYPGVVRSINLQHSVCAYGRLADYFTSEHHKSITAWDEYSPFYKLCQFDNSIVYTLGVPKLIGTIKHCPESLLRNKYVYFNKFFTKKVTYDYIDTQSKRGSHTFLTQDFSRKENKKLFPLLLNKGLVKRKYLSNLCVEATNAKITLELLLDLASSKGQTIYLKPSPRDYRKNGLFIEF